MKDSAYNKAAGTVVDFKGDKGAEGLALGVANEDGTRAYGTVGRIMQRSWWI